MLNACGGADIDTEALTTGDSEIPPTGNVDGGTVQTDSGTALVSGLSCTKLSVGLVFEYFTAVYTDGSRFVSCAISDGYGTYSNTEIFGATQNGAASGLCILVYDLEWNGTSGFWSFTFSGSSSIALYSDTGSTYNGNSVSMSGSSECSSITY
jgi:hypothetical protein